MEYLAGISMALAVGAFATAAGLDRERGFYPVVLCVVASYYALFAAMGGSFHGVALETWIAFGFVALAVWGFKRNLWLVVLGLFGHGAMDVVHPLFLANPGEPAWWPMFCMSYDTVAAGYLALTLIPVSNPAVAAELDAAEACQRQGLFAEAFHHLERAHVLGQASTLEHVRVHLRMLHWSLQQGDPREALGQLFRIAGATTMTVFGLVPRGNTGGSNVSAFHSMPVPADLAALLSAAARRDLRAVAAAAAHAGERFGLANRRP
jgi:hypothetical protein